MSNIEKVNNIVNNILSTGKISPTIETLEYIDEIATLMKEEDHYLSSLYTSLTSSYYQAIDKRIKKETKNQNFSCTHGCSHCCKELKIGIPTLETDYLVDYLNTLNIDIKETISKKLEELNIKYSDKKVNKRDGLIKTLIEQETILKYDCPFLINNACSIYEARPIMCRIYLSKDKQSCFDGKADSVLEMIYVKSLKGLLEHKKNQTYTTKESYHGSFPFFTIKYGNNKFYSLNKYNKFTDFISTIIN